MFKHTKSIAVIVSALAIATTGVTTVSSAAFSKSADIKTVDDNSSETNAICRSAISESKTGAIRCIPQRLASLISGVALTSNYTPIYSHGATDVAAYQSAMNKIKGYHSTIYCPQDYRYAQKTDTYFGGDADKWMCSAYAIATAKSIYDGKQWFPNDVACDTVNGAYWEEVTKVDVGDNPDLTEDEILLAIDAQLEMGKPALIQAKRNSDGGLHWAVVIGKSSSGGTVGSRYTIIDPWNGSQCSLGEMMYYRDGGTFVGYAILDQDVYTK